MDNPKQGSTTHRTNDFGGIQKTFMTNNAYDARTEELKLRSAACDRSNDIVQHQVASGNKRFSQELEDMPYAHSVWLQRSRNLELREVGIVFAWIADPESTRNQVSRMME